MRKRVRKLTRKEKIIVSESNLNPKNWLLKEITTEKIRLIHKVSKREREINLKGGLIK